MRNRQARAAAALVFALSSVFAVMAQPPGSPCFIGLNCGCIRNCHTPHPRPPDDAGDPHDPPPTPAPPGP